MRSHSRPRTPENSNMQTSIRAYEPLTPVTPTHKRVKSLDLAPIKCHLGGEFSGDLVVSARPSGKGTFSQVYPAHCGSRSYAVKVPRKNALLNVFDNELSALRTIGNGHAHILKFWGTWHGDGLVFDWYDSDVEQAVKEVAKHTDTQFEPVIGLDMWRRWAAALSSALAYLHKVGIIHSDLKPNNLLVNTRAGLGIPVIADFSFAKGRDGAIGTPSPVYTAPELRGNGGLEPTFSSDVYALGVVLAFCATGQEAYAQAKNSYQRAMWQQSISPLDSFDDELAMRLWPVRPTIEAMVTSRSLPVA